MNKYQQLLIKNVRSQLDEWLHMPGNLKQEELYRFLHSIKGTGATIGLGMATDVAARLMDELEEEDKKVWNKEELQSFLFPLISVFYYEDYIGETPAELENEKRKDSLVLLIEDRPQMIMYVKEVMDSSDSVVMAATNAERAFTSFYELTPQCVLVAAHLQANPEWTYLHELHKHADKRLIPQIILGSEDSKEERMSAYLQGADDFLSPFVEADELAVRINNQVNKKKKTDQYLLIDELTGVYNRKHLIASYRRLISELERKQTSFAIVLLDIDHFKEINDTYGHAIGDRVLEELGAFLKRSIRPGDVVIRYGGEEFLLLLSSICQAAAEGIIQRVLDDFSRLTFEDGKGGNFECTFSAGVLEITDSMKEMKEAFVEVDQALYAAKRGGRNQIRGGLVSAVSSRKRIMVGIIDDDPIIRTILIDLIQKSPLAEPYDIEIESFKDGLHFTESKWFEKEKVPYLILLDGVMPKMDGLEVLQFLRERPDEKKFTIMMLTSRKSEQDIARGIRLGADDYMTKPFKPLELETRVGYLLKRM